MFRKIPWEGWRVAFLPPNIITYLRLAAVWFPACLLVTGFHDPAARWQAAIWFAGIASTDWVDGFIARRYHMESRWGAFVDPIADKLLVAVVLVTVAVVCASTSYGWIIISTTVFFLLRELILTWQIYRANDESQPPTMTGKLKTVFQMGMIGAWIAPIQEGLGLMVVAALTCYAIIWTYVSWIDYYRLYVSKTITQ